VSAEVIAKMVSDLRKGRFSKAVPTAAQDEEAAWEVINDVARTGQATAMVATEVIDATAMVTEVEAFVTRMQKAQGGGVASVGNVEATSGLTLAPPWEMAVIGYDHNDTAGVITMYSGKYDHANTSKWWDTEEDGDGNKVTVEWERVGWVIMAALFTNEGPNGSLYGPTEFWRIAVYEDGAGAYVWCKGVAPQNHYAYDMMILLNTLNICNASNVYLDEPVRQRAERRRVERTGVRVTEIHVRSTKGYKRSNGKAVVLQPGTPLTSVRGHMAEYGPKYGKGLLFGRIEGKFWIPQHVRGTEDCGIIEHKYIIDPN
jgi:hypothetical protein